MFIGEITHDQWPELDRKLRARFVQEDLKSRPLSMPKAKDAASLPWANQPNFRNGWDDILKSKSNWKVEGVAQIAWYVDARAVRRRLNDVVGSQNWETKVKLQTDGVECSLGIKIGGQMVWKSDVSQYTEIEGTKGGASKALIRAATNWGIGEYLYDVMQYWPITKGNKGWNFDNKFSGKWMDFRIAKEWLPDSK